MFKNLSNNSLFVVIFTQYIITYTEYLSFNYCKYLNFGWLVFYITDYEKRKELAPSLTYVSYLRTTFPESFFIKLITCPVCISFWINVLCSIGVSNWSIFFVNCWLSLALYYMLGFLSRLSMEKING